MFTKYDIYIIYNDTKKDITGKGYRIPKDFEYYYKNKLSKSSQDGLQGLADRLNTIWQDIDVYRYMHIGFKLYKSFGYGKLLDEKILSTYIRQDKEIKRNISLDRDKIKQSLEYARSKVDKINTKDVLIEYARDNRQVISDYLYNRIDGGFLFWLINDKYIDIDDLERNIIPYVERNKNQLREELVNLRPFLNSL